MSNKADDVLELGKFRELTEDEKRAVFELARTSNAQEIERLERELKQAQARMRMTFDEWYWSADSLRISRP